ncbi:hypothetical protein TDB9533_03362 [Thalassocella blandensis]|nr:hypothetical protein TDB9533_03362 [Thalassocella blandensis]
MNRRHRNAHDQFNEQYEKVVAGRKNGYGMNLYRNTKDKYLGGVCSGLAEHFEIDPVIMRILFVAGFIVTGGTIAFWAYILGWILLSPKPREGSKPQYEYDEAEKCYRKKKIFRYRESPSTRIQRAQDRLDEVVAKVEDMENYVTSNRYQLEKEFADLEK